MTAANKHSYNPWIFIETSWHLWRKPLFVLHFNISDFRNDISASFITWGNHCSGTPGMGRGPPGSCSCVSSGGKHDSMQLPSRRIDPWCQLWTCTSELDVRTFAGWNSSQNLIFQCWVWAYPFHFSERISGHPSLRTGVSRWFHQLVDSSSNAPSTAFIFYHCSTVSFDKAQFATRLWTSKTVDQTPFQNASTTSSILNNTTNSITLYPLLKNHGSIHLCQSACCTSPGVSVRSDLKPAVSGFRKETLPKHSPNLTIKPSNLCEQWPKPWSFAAYTGWNTSQLYRDYNKPLKCQGFKRYASTSSTLNSDFSPLPRDHSRSASSAWMVRRWGESNLHVKHREGFLV